MRAWFTVMALTLLCILTGCWDKAELTEFGYVQAIALDKGERGKAVLTTHFYKPSSGGGIEGAGKAGAKGVSLRTEANTVFEAVRDIAIQFGRKAKWDHMRVILIGEDLAGKEDIRKILDFFSRDHEPRPTVNIIITKGNAANYLKIKPFIEHTIGQQLQKIQEASAAYAAKTSKIPLFELAIQFMNETNVVMVPYIYSEDSPNVIAAAGIALLKNGKLTTIVTPAHTKSLVMLLDQYKKGILEFPCMEPDENKEKAMESFEVMSLKTKIKTAVQGEEVVIKVLTQIEGSLGELRCTSIKTEEEEKRLEDHIKKYIEQNLRKTIALLQNEKLDALGIGDEIYRRNPELWKRWKPTWAERFAVSQVNIQIKLNITDSGLKISTPFVKTEE